MGMEPKKILLVDDDELITMSLEMIITAAPEFVVAGKGQSGRQAVSLYKEIRPDVLLMDIRMEDMNGLEAAEEILAEDPNACILFLTTFSDDEYIIKALELGVRGYLLKQDYKSLIASLHAVMNGQSVFGGEVTGKLPNLMENRYSGSYDYQGAGITEKEYQVIQLVADGLSNKEIAEKIFLSEGTVRNYLSSTLEKLDLRDRTQLAIFYLKHCQV